MKISTFAQKNTANLHRFLGFTAERPAPMRCSLDNAGLNHRVKRQSMVYRLLVASITALGLSFSRGLHGVLSEICAMRAAHQGPRGKGFFHYTGANFREKGSSGSDQPPGRAPAHKPKCSRYFGLAMKT